MKDTLISDAQDQTFIAAFEEGDDVLASLEAFARRHQIRSAHFFGKGAVREATLSVHDWKTGVDRRTRLEGARETLSLIGDVALAPDGRPAVAAAIVLVDPDGTLRGGRLVGATALPPLAVSVMASPNFVRERPDPRSGLPVLDATNAASVY